jgi:hypothetical protein
VALGGREERRSASSAKGHTKGPKTRTTMRPKGQCTISLEAEIAAMLNKSTIKVSEASYPETPNKPLKQILPCSGLYGCPGCMAGWATGPSPKKAAVQIPPTEPRQGGTWSIQLRPEDTKHKASLATKTPGAEKLVPLPKTLVINAPMLILLENSDHICKYWYFDAFLPNKILGSATKNYFCSVLALKRLHTYFLVALPKKNSFCSSS